ncbi:MAG: hypothetical protein M1829_004088 [Trizodia sp. TS-e1964]|nr:MAG: hypothetical protein M1829_004088 [Trizodia sp. TS-e1964]
MVSKRLLESPEDSSALSAKPKLKKHKTKDSSEKHKIPAQSQAQNLRDLLHELLSDTNKSKLCDEVGKDIVEQCSKLRSSLDSKAHSQAQASSPQLPLSHPAGQSSEINWPPEFDVAEASAILSFDLTDWTYPPLPLINDPKLRNATFTHQGSIIMGAPFPQSYEQLEFVGDAYIEVMATRLIYRIMPWQTASRMSQIREMLVKNETLATYSKHYRLDENLVISSDMRQSSMVKGHAHKPWTKILADVFEAYVASVILSTPQGGFDLAEQWLSQVWQPVLVSQAKELIKSQLPSKTPKVDLSRMLLAPGLRLDYRQEREPLDNRKRLGRMNYYMGVYFTGLAWNEQHLGSGEGESKSAASQQAAAKALKNEQILEPIREARRKYLVAREKAKAREASDVLVK